MRCRYLLASILAALVLGGTSHAAPILPGTGPSLDAPGQIVLVGNGDGSFRRDLNRVRERRGRDAVRHDRQLERAAQAYAEQMSRNGRFSHTGQDGSNPWDRAQGADCNCTAVAENIARGPANPRQVFRSWIRSQGHRQNMLGRDYDSYGLGRSGDTWVLMLSD